MNIIDWNSIPYKTAWEQQELHFQKLIEAKRLKESTEYLNTLFLCEHEHVYTLGRNGQEENLLIREEMLHKIGAQFFKIDRGGDITYHGPGQLVGYPIIDLEHYKISLKEYVFLLEEAIIQTLLHYGISSSRMEHATGVWIDAQLPTARKIAAIGVRASRFITMHGFALNVNTNLDYFTYINPCGLANRAVTSIAKEVGHVVDFEETKKLIANNINNIINEKS